MDTTAPTTRTRTKLGALCLALGAPCFAVVALVNPYGPGDNQVHDVRHAGSALTIYSLVWFAGSMLFVAGGATVVGRIRGRGATLALIGGSLAVAGSVASAAVAAFESVAISLNSAFTDDATLKQALKSFDNSLVLSLVYVVFLGGFAFGWPLLMGAAARGGLVRVWYVIPVVLGFLGQASLNGDSPAALVLAFSALSIVPNVVLAQRLAFGRPVETVESQQMLAPATA